MTFASGDWIASWSQVVISLGIIFGGVGVVLRWMKKNVSNPLKAVPIIQTQTNENHQALTKLNTDLTNVTIEVAKIKTEVTPNGGSSLRDSVIRQEKVNANVAVAVENIGKSLEQHVVVDEQSLINITNAIKQINTTMNRPKKTGA